MTYQPFLVALKALWLEFLDGHYHSGTWLGGGESVGINPTLEHAAETAFSEETVGAEVLGRVLHVAEAEGPHIGWDRHRAIVHESLE